MSSQVTALPVRIQRSRAKGSRLPPGAVCVDRSTKWGNPHRVSPKATAAQCVARFAYDVEHRPWLVGFDPRDIARLRGKSLACWCPLDQPCHADVLLEIANRPLTCEAVE